ncbi:hypothetical protein HL658_32260 [Azospirillum sp. RWY-5-1]|uniref:CheW-like domain-containing protein n=1 Tax=Azospirillum oleiclasticum TaxID=2735135 RepID=A0ABX2THD2_9PROT|nr:hypothetical protein [Azospirillum oleiclasticum]NYZ17244.1 hypothetical protein [Azospirillum oleiclasticum]NYZ23472.1 hypothetical protein [Azospirillum oleiclasticum]
MTVPFAGAGVPEGGQAVLRPGIDRPGIARPGIDRLVLVLGGRRVTVDARSVVRIEETSAVGPLPLVRAPVRGIVAVNGRPAVLVGDEAGKLVALSCEGGLLALRVAAVEVCGAQDAAPPLDLGGLAPWARPATIPRPAPSGAGAAGSRRLVALRVITGGSAVLIPLDGIRRVAPVDAVREDEGDGPVVLVDGRLRRGRSLSRWRGLPDRPEPTALLLDGHEEAITVERVAGLATLHADRLHSVPGGDDATPRQWLVAADGTITECLSIDRILGRTPATGPAGPAAAEPPRAAGAGRHRAGGLRLSCGGTTLVAPLDGVLGLVDPLALAWQPRRTRGAGMVPVADLRRLFGGEAGAGHRRRCCAAGLMLGGAQPLIVLADAAALDADRDAPDWQQPPPMPPGPSSLIDAVRPDPRSGGWALRLRLDPPSPAALRSAAAAALSGWADAGSVATIGRLAAASHRAPSGDA